MSARTVRSPVCSDARSPQWISAFAAPDGVSPSGARKLTHPIDP